ncbi:MAG TPA: DUF3502 domain-containing protein [Bacteroidales bacterium]|nr:DUF3502 domain-containing protein [Bacteroidales bacterium]
MKKLVSKMTAIGLIGLLILTGCAKNLDSSPENLVDSTNQSEDTITLEWWYRGNGIQKDTELVEQNLNELLGNYAGLENVSIKLNSYTGSEYKNAVQLAQAANKQIDILNTVGLDFAEEVEKKTYLSLNEVSKDFDIDKWGIPDWLWDIVSVDEEIYMVPNFQRAANMNYFITPKQYMDQYGDIDKMRKIFQDGNNSVTDVADVVMEYANAIREGEGNTKYVPPIGSMYHSTYGFTNYFDTITGEFRIFNGENKVVNRFMSEEVKEAYGISAQWYEAGLIHPDILTIEENDYQGKNMLNDISYVFTMNNQAGDEERVSEIYTAMYGFDTYAIPIKSDYYITNTWAAGGNGITNTCKNPKEAMRFIELLTTDEGKEIYNLLVYGIEGTHYEKIDENHIKTFEYDGTQGGVDTSYAGIKWIIGNTLNAYLNQACLDDENEIALEINNSSTNKRSDLIGFTANIENITTALEQTTAVSKEHSKVLEVGVMESKWESYYEEYVNRMEKAGLSKILMELQGQVDSYIK